MSDRASLKNSSSIVPYRLEQPLTHGTNRNDAPGLAYLARTGFFKPVHMKSLSAHALRSLIIARKKTGGPASDLGESDPRFGGRVREHNPSIPVGRCAQTAVIEGPRSERVKSPLGGSSYCFSPLSVSVVPSICTERSPFSGAPCYDGGTAKTDHPDTA
jgi:hypothetical protein